MMQVRQRGVCPFRVSTVDFQPGCILQLGRDSLCYSQDARPLLFSDNQYFCPLLPDVNLTVDTYNEIESLVSSVLTIQDKDEICTNLWSMLSGIANMKNKAATAEGKKIEALSQKVKNLLEDIVLNLS